ncbi:tetratricopeptide repeat protein [Palleronia sp. LCG004]|uniref:tetratricopeptide repeat protein n=1 Tax=Palleronia sp. LCG004 TaxID=3079304 RepID=UPI002941FFBA|nr:tetratricopeptide repeat protein [Palleronia sp. LCG004]WOI57288.1 tetratricopeptide repeat protein [Palleronia sp. LCG004]
MGILKPLVTALALCAVHPALAQDRLDDLYTALASAQEPDARRIAEKIASEWMRSGSPAMDVLLARGQEALDAGDTQRAIEHLSALIDHAPDFAEGYHARATAFFRDRRMGLALDDLRTTLALNPRHFGALSGVGVILADLGREDLALRAWREVEALYPAHPEAQAAIQRLEIVVEGSRI